LWTSGTTTNSVTISDSWVTWTRDNTIVRAWQDETWNHWIQFGNSPPTIATPVYNDADLRRVPQAPALVRSEAEWAEIRRENERLRAERDKLQASARAEARKLLEFILTKEQVASYDKNKYFDVVGSAGTVFRVHHGTSGNVRQLVDGREVNALCAHPRLYDDERKDYLPTEDCLAAQALAIMHDESQFLQVANVHRGPRHLAVVREGVAA
jgi:hypothetical protein